MATNNTENLDKLKTSASGEAQRAESDLEVAADPRGSDRLAQEYVRNHQRQDLRLLYELRQDAGRESGAGTPGLGAVPRLQRPATGADSPARLFKEMQGVKSNKGLNEQDKLAKTTEIQAQLDDLERLNNALSAMSSVSKAVQ